MGPKLIQDTPYPNLKSWRRRTYNGIHVHTHPPTTEETAIPPKPRVCLPTRPAKSVDQETTRIIQVILATHYGKARCNI